LLQVHNDGLTNLVAVIMHAWEILCAS